MSDRPTPTHALLYRSQSAGRPADEDVALLALRSSRQNAQVGVTGLLLYAEPVGAASGLFVQRPEGPRAAVRALYERVRGDDRHVHWRGRCGGADGLLFPRWDTNAVPVGGLPVTLDGLLDLWLSLRDAPAPPLTTRPQRVGGAAYRRGSTWKYDPYRRT